MLRWNRQYHLDTARPISFHAQVRQSLRPASWGVAGGAYRLAVAVERHAVRHGDQQLAKRMQDVVIAVSPKLPISRPATLTELERAAARAAAAELWVEALDYTEAILAQRPASPSVRLRALANRASALQVMGRLSEAVPAYDQLQADGEAWQRLALEYRIGFAVAREAAQWYRGHPVELAVVGDATPYLGQAPVTWMGYWWLLGHVAMRRHPTRLAGIRHSSLRSFGLDWQRHWDQALWGLDLFIATGEAEVGTAERRLHAALTDPATLQCIGRSSWIDLYGDWLAYLLTHRPLDAPAAVERFVAWCRHKGYDGWASYWENRLSQSPAIVSAGRRNQ